MSANYSPNRSPGSSRLQLGNISRLRSSSVKKPPEPLRRAVADSLSLSHPGNPSEAFRILRDYLAAQITTDLAYSVIIEHTLAERERSPAVVTRCVALLKRYLLRYKPSEETLLQIDRFCVSIIRECNISPNRKLSAWSRSSSKAGASATSSNTTQLPVSSFASGALVKSLNYVRSLVAQHVPKRSFEPAAFTAVPSTSRQLLPSLSSMLSKSFNSHLNPANAKESSDLKEGSAASVSNSLIAETVDGIEDLEFIPFDIFKWRWHGDQRLSLLSSDSDHVMNSQDVSKHSFLEIGAAALLVGDVEAKMKGELWRSFGAVDMPFFDKLLQTSLLTTVTNSASARSHMRAITASKRSKTGSLQIWEDSNVSTYRPRPRPLFQYRHYSEQQPLKLNSVEVCEVIAAVCSETPSPTTNLMTVSSKLSSSSGKPSMDVAVSVLIKLVIDMYVMDSATAAPLTLSMLEEMLNAPRLASKSRAFDLILNLGVHAQLLEPLVADDVPTIEEEYSQEPYLDSETQLANQGTVKPDYYKTGNSSAIDKFESWILGILYEILLHLVQIEEKEESIWASALSCLLYFVCHRGKIRRSRLEGLDARVLKVLIQVSRRNSWAEIVHCKLICMFTNMFYEVPDGSTTSSLASPRFLVEQIDLIGGIEFVYVEFALANLRDDRRNLYMILFDYVLHQINEACLTSGVSEYSDDESQVIATLLTLADAPEALHISVRLGVDGVGDLLKRSVASALSRYANCDRLNLLQEKIIERFDTIVRSFSNLDTEFSHLRHISKSHTYLESIEDGVLRNDVCMKAKLAWATLHSLLHSERVPYRQNGYLWLGDLLVAEINDKKDAIWLNVKNLQQKIALAGVNDYSEDLDVPLSIWLLCGLLKSKNSLIRWGFLFVLDRLLVRCKFLLDEKKIQHLNNDAPEHLQQKSRLEKASAVIDVMSTALSLVAQINETDRLNILKMCSILFSQLCLKVLPSSSVSCGDALHDDAKSGTSCGEDPMEDTKSKFSSKNDTLTSETASMAALLLRGQAVVPMQLVARVPAALFYWPLIQLASAATDNIALGVSVGSKGRGNIPGATSDIRATLLLLLVGKCTAEPAAFREVGGDDFFRELLDDTDSRVAYYSSTFLLKRMMTEEPESYQRMLSNLVYRAQQSNNEKLLENPYLQMRGILQLLNE
ncbi:Vacuolar protein sorting/targeting protein like [Heracleum sosnowskyi]|uniref:Vacuolar protein sorting/targeting protein like n=1 Tax=Heracleum sosnowskyi TaxID=360622 RepID=A0AAD8J4Y5_9APIA|nr:Vacuolar protein sorting/targeting protein like [Heracleum sosnowskyi]